MLEAQVINAPNGEKLAVLSWAVYESLCEALDDAVCLQAYEEVKHRLATGEEELVPSEYADRIIDGENPVRVWRDYRGLSVKDLAEQAGISPAYLSQIETGKRDGRISTMKAIASVLNVDLDDLV